LGRKPTSSKKEDLQPLLVGATKESLFRLLLEEKLSAQLTDEVEIFLFTQISSPSPILHRRW